MKSFFFGSGFMCWQPPRAPFEIIGNAKYISHRCLHWLCLIILHAVEIFFCDRENNWLKKQIVASLKKKNREPIWWDKLRVVVFRQFKIFGQQCLHCQIHLLPSLPFLPDGWQGREIYKEFVSGRPLAPALLHLSFMLRWSERNIPPDSAEFASCGQDSLSPCITVSQC